MVMTRGYKSIMNRRAKFVEMEMRHYIEHRNNNKKGGIMENNITFEQWVKSALAGVRALLPEDLPNGVNPYSDLCIARRELFLDCLSHYCEGWSITNSATHDPRDNDEVRDSWDETLLLDASIDPEDTFADIGFNDPMEITIKGWML